MKQSDLSEIFTHLAGIHKIFHNKCDLNEAKTHFLQVEKEAWLGIRSILNERIHSIEAKQAKKERDTTKSRSISIFEE